MLLPVLALSGEGKFLDFIPAGDDEAISLMFQELEPLCPWRLRNALTRNQRTLQNLEPVIGIEIVIKRRVEIPEPVISPIEGVVVDDDSALFHQGRHVD